MKKAIAMLCVVALAGCAGLNQFSPQVQAGLTTADKYVGEFVAGAQQEAPLVIALAALAGAPQKDIDAAQGTLAVASAAQAVLHDVATSGTGDPATATSNAFAALRDINKAVGTVQAVVDKVKGVSAVPTQ